MFNFFRFRESENSIVLDLLLAQKERINKGEATLDGIYDEIMADPKPYIDAVKKNGITNLMTICGSMGNNDERSNGTGKSTILESITYALYGCIVRQAINSIRNESIHDVITCINGYYPKGLKETWVEWLFEEKGKLYIIRRGVSVSGKSKTPQALFWDVTNGEKVSLTGHRTKETSEQILKIIGYDFEVFSSSIMFGQNDAGQFLIGKDKDRKEMIVKILHLEDVVAGCLDSVRESKNEKNKEIEQLTMKSGLIAQWIASKPAIEDIIKKIDDIKKLVENCDTETKKNNDEVERLSKSDILKEIETLKTEGIKIKSDVATKKTEIINQTKEWTDVLNNITTSILKKTKEMCDSNTFTIKLESREAELTTAIKSFDLENAKKNLEIVEKAKLAKPVVAKKCEELLSKESNLLSDIAVEDASLVRLRPEFDSLQKQLSSAGQKDQFICDKCKSVVSKKHVEEEAQKVKDAYDVSRAKKSSLNNALDVLRKELGEAKEKKETVGNWLIREGQILASIQKHDSDRALLVDISRQVVESKSTTSRLVLDLALFEEQKRDCNKKIVSISSKYQDEIKTLEMMLNEIRDKYIKADADSKAVKFDIEILRKKNEDVSDRKSLYSSQIGSLNKEIENIEGETKSLKEVKAELDNKTKEFQRYILLDDIFGLDGIQTRIVNKYLPTLNRYIEEFLTVLSNGEMMVQITTNSAGAIDIDIQGNSGNSYNMISGGEKGILRLAVSIGLALLSFVRTAQKPEMIALDEIFSNLDNERKMAVFRLLSKLQTRFSRIVVISHDRDINERIPNKIIVEKSEGKNGTSKIRSVC